MPVVDIASNGHYRLDRMTWSQFMRAVDLLTLVTTHTIYLRRQEIIDPPVLGASN